MSADGSLSGDSGTVVQDSADPEIASLTSRPVLRRKPAAAILLEAAAKRVAAMVPVWRRGLRLADLRKAGTEGGPGVQLARQQHPDRRVVMRSVLDGFQEADRWRESQRSQRWAPHDFREIRGSSWLVIGLGASAPPSRRAKAFGASVVGCRRNPTGAGPRPMRPSPRTSSPLRRVRRRCGRGGTRHPPHDGVDRLRLPGDHEARLTPRQRVQGKPDRRGPRSSSLWTEASGDGDNSTLFSVEPLPAGHRLWSHPAVVVTPHNAALGVGRYGRQTDLFVENLDRYLTGRELLNDVTDDLLAG